MAGGNDSRLTAADVMTPAPRSCSAFSTVLEATLIFRDADCGSVPVLDENGKPVGVLTDRDVALAVADYPDLAGRPVADVMTKGAVTIAPETPLDDLRERFGAGGVRRLLVVDSAGLLRGIVAWADIAPHLTNRAVGQVVTEVVQS